MFFQPFQPLNVFQPFNMFNQSCSIVKPRDNALSHDCLSVCLSYMSYILVLHHVEEQFPIYPCRDALLQLAAGISLYYLGINVIGIIIYS